jgi:hypothetical protein
VLLHRERE